ncbi:exodeoxyribonuclease V subunit beta [Mycobacterium koreense]|uniref:RecBCD enzyme subunit RecB n=1 Tax=Mycolicibacillus koreensis TaxID=1069220 RepID=A0A7I7SGG1_9MYCO|nr:exodeoxyribonuclease V subunit beta [Mycolicibacillus koreensis]MCV7248140.1 exodeoxyribonuclease V subunit beta [Mycolicibacillus koreensis]OSC35853.1 exodeoxyribonuclease V subunit beta [Mycolicibacillus koreensis]BBY55076.1 RecBCD enzyme subunit RecB [Mycolicibacillus koreensis]
MSAAPFELSGPLPSPGSTLVLEASAGTGKTFALAGLVTRYVADGHATLDQLLLITFGRVASRELRERVRDQIAAALAVLEDRRSPANTFETQLRDVDEAVRAERVRRLRAALAGFDAATIVTIHQFCSLVLKSLGVAGDTDPSVTLVESLTDLVTEIVDDLYLARFGHDENPPALTRNEALELATRVVEDPAAQLRPRDPEPGSATAARRQFALEVLDELDRRKRRLGVLGYNDLLTRLADSLSQAGSDAAERMRRRWSIVMVDEFQDTDPVQWQVIDRAFRGHSTLVLIGDPKQAIYGFRGGDIYTYLAAARSADDRRTLTTNYRSDAVLVDSLQVLLGGAQLGHPEIVAQPVAADRPGHRLSGAPHNAPVRLRVVARDTVGASGTQTVPISVLRDHIPADLAADIGALLGSGAQFDGRPVQAGDIAVIVGAHADARACRDALVEAGIPVVYTGDTDVFTSPAARDWLCLLEAFDQPHRSALVRAAACTAFFGETAETLSREGDLLTDRVADTLREWTDHARSAGIAAVLEAAQLAGMGRRVLSRHGGERLMTDLVHVGQLLQEAAHRDRLGLPGLRDWLRRQCEERTGAAERNRRLDSDAAAVQIMTVFVAKGLQFPIVYLPFAFNRHIFRDEILLYHDTADGADVRCLHLGGRHAPDRRAVNELHRLEAARDNIRLTYVALTRAQSQVVAWWAPTYDEVNGGLSRLLRGRRRGEAEVPVACERAVTDADAWAVFTDWQQAGALTLEPSVVGPPVTAPRQEADGPFAVRHFDRAIDLGWRRTSYSALLRHAEQAGTAGVHSEPEVAVRSDEPFDEPFDEPQIAAAATGVADTPGTQIRSPMADLPRGAAFGSLVHATLETTDPTAADLTAALRTEIERHTQWWPIDVAPADLAVALLPMQDTPLGPLAEDLTLRQIGLQDRLCELDFEIPLMGGDGPDGPELRLADLAPLLREHLPASDPFACYADRLASEALGGQSLRGYLSGSIDAVLRLPGPRYLVVDYKTNFLGESAGDYGPAALVEAMLHSDYPLQALLYAAVAHRFLRWRQPDYNPRRHLGGVVYLFLRGMCGPDTPRIDDHPTGVFSWLPPPGLVTALSELLHRGPVAS